MRAALLSPLRSPLRGPLDESPLTLVQKAIGILRKYGTNAHVYLPGIGVVSGITAGNYLDSTGTTAATVDNPVGLALDALQAMTLGAELVTNGDFSAGTTGWTLSSGAAVSANALSLPSASAQANQTSMSVLANSTYKITFDVSGAGAGLFLDMSIGGTFIGGAVIGASNGPKSFIVPTINANTLVFLNDPGSTGACTIDNISVKQVPGIHASQSTTASKPILRSSGGRYSWEFDGSNDYLSLGAPLFQMSDDHCVGVAFKCATAANYNGVFEQRNTASGTPLAPALEYNNGTLYAFYRDDASASLTLSASIAVSETAVASVRKSSSNYTLNKNGVQAGLLTGAFGTTTINSAAFGASGFGPGNFFAGNTNAAYAIKATVPDADRLTLDRWLGSLAGVSF